MKRKELFVLVLVLAFCAPMIFGFGGPAPEEPQAPTETAATDGGAGAAVYPALIDNFEDGDISKDPSWWKFDAINLKIEKAAKLSGGDPIVEEEVGEFAIKINGSTTKWYVGGFGSYIAKDTAGYSAMSLDVWGSGKNSGKIKVELYDDDNGNMQVEQDKNFQPTSDDRFVYEINVNWSGWKKVKIPLTSFKDDNPGIGDDKLNATATDGSGGLLHIQIIAISTTQTGSVNMAIDNVELTN